jgi:hypothetical protein
MALKKGICKNFENCTLADNNEIQEVDSSEFRCTECGKELHEITDERHRHFPTKLIFIIVAAIILIGGGIWAYFGLIKGCSDKVEESVSLSLNKDEISLYVGESDTLVATVSAQPSDAKVSVSFTSNNPKVVNIGNDGAIKAISQGEAYITVIARMESGIADTIQVKVVTYEVNYEPNPIPKPKDTNYNPREVKVGICKIPFDWFIYEGPCENGKPADGIWGKMRVTRKHTIDLKDGSGGTLEVNCDDVIVNPQFRGGKWMLQGELHRTDGTRRVL